MATAAEQKEHRAFTNEHIDTVQKALRQVCDDLERRRKEHDASKLKEPEFSGFLNMRINQNPSETEYNSPEYRAALQRNQDTITRHYQGNDHHPEYFTDGWRGMGLHQQLEMLADWYAASQQYGRGSLRSSIEKNQERFGYTDETKRALLNTAAAFGWLD